MTSTTALVQIALIGIGATAVLDAWIALLQRLGVKTQDMALVGRWIGHLTHGRVLHESIARSRPVTGERALGWLTHYAIGIAFAALLVFVQGTGWVSQPALLPAVLVGMATVLAPFAVMQPAMGSGFAASRTPAPWSNRLRSLTNHTIFGLGMYLSALVISVSA